MSEESRLPALPQDRIEQTEDSTFRQAARGRIVALPFALGLMALGGLLLAEPQIEGFNVTLPIAGLILLAAFVLTNLFRFFASGRRERGLFFLALVILVLGAILAVISISGREFEAMNLLTFLLVGIAGALLITFTFERQHDSRMLALIALLLVASSITFLVSQEAIPAKVVEMAGDYFPLLIAFLGVILVPLAFRRPVE